MTLPTVFPTRVGVNRNEVTPDDITDHSPATRRRSTRRRFLRHSRNDLESMAPLLATRTLSRLCAIHAGETPGKLPELFARHHRFARSEIHPQRLRLLVPS